jgi:hypothetical protein
MRKIDDSKLYLYAAIVALVVGIVLGAISYYSILVVEPKVERLLSAKEDVDKNFREAYLILRDPQIFAGYENFDSDRVKNSLTFFDNKIYSGEKIDADRKMYLDILLDRRKDGSTLGRNTMVFFIILSLAAWALFIRERKAARE